MDNNNNESPGIQERRMVISFFFLTGVPLYTHIFFVASIRSSRPWISVCIRSFILW